MKKFFVKFLFSVSFIFFSISCSQQIFPGMTEGSGQVEENGDSSSGEEIAASGVERAEETENAATDSGNEDQNGCDEALSSGAADSAAGESEKEESAAEAVNSEEAAGEGGVELIGKETVIQEVVNQEITNQEVENYTTNENYYTYYGYDELYYLDDITVSAKAWPGVNIVSWKPVAAAQSYLLYKYEEGIPCGVYSFAYNDTLIFSDSDIQNGTEYTYIVEAESKSSPSRSIAVQNKVAEVSLQAIVPSAFVKSLELPAYEEGYTGEVKEVGLDEGVIEPENISVSWDNGTLAYSFPAKAYLTYSLYAFKGNEYSVNKMEEAEGVFLGNYRSYVNNKIITGNARLLTSGKYTICIVANAVNTMYEASAYVEASETVTVPCPDLKEATSDLSASYIDSGKTARIRWKPAVLEDDSKVPVSAYNVYSYDNDSRVYVKQGIISSADDYYYCVVSVDDYLVEQNYMVVLSYNDAYEEKGNYVSLNPYIVLEEGTPVEISDVAIEVLEEVGKVYGKASFYLVLAENQEIVSMKYASVEDEITKENVMSIDFDEFVDFKADEASVAAKNLNYKIIIEDLAIHKKLAVRLEISEEGKKNAVSYYISDVIKYEISDPEIIIGHPSSDTGIGTVYIYEKGCKDGDILQNYRYLLLYAKAEDSTYSVSNETEWKEAFSGELSFTKYSFGYYADMKYTMDETSGHFVFKLIKTNIAADNLETFQYINESF